MCFSATASFTSGVVLHVIGIACLTKTQHPSQQLFAGIPFLFGIQQIAEGVLWLTIPNPGDFMIQQIFTYLFLFFAQILWPVWVPLSFLMLEKNKTRARIQLILVVIGFIVSIYLLFCMLCYGAESQIVEHHISYIQEYPLIFRGYGILFYGAATILPAFFSSLKSMWIFGSAILISYVISAIFYGHYMLSVWCFFSAVISISIYFIIINMTRSQEDKMMMM